MANDNDASEPTIGLSKNGPLLVKGLSTFRNSRGEDIATKDTIALCR
jgi:hypothetical protein